MKTIYIAVLMSVFVVFLMSCAAKRINEEELMSRITANSEIGDAKTTVALIRKVDTQNFSDKNKENIQILLNRFGGNYKRELISSDDPALDVLLNLYEHYWWQVLTKSKSVDAADKEIIQWFESIFGAKEIQDSQFNLEKSLQDYLQLKGGNRYYFLMGRTPPLLELMVWKNNNEKKYTVHLVESDVEITVQFIGEFISNGWLNYATAGKSMTGGWTTDDKVVCLGDEYDRQSEKFELSILKHEGQHFSDRKIFKKLAATDLEYRAKLSELAFAQTTMFKLIDDFKAESKNDPQCPHCTASFRLIQNLSKEIAEKNVSKINSAAAQLLKENTIALTSHAQKREKDGTAGR